MVWSPVAFLIWFMSELDLGVTYDLHVYVGVGKLAKGDSFHGQCNLAAPLPSFFTLM